MRKFDEDKKQTVLSAFIFTKTKNHLSVTPWSINANQVTHFRHSLKYQCQPSHTFQASTSCSYVTLLYKLIVFTHSVPTQCTAFIHRFFILDKPFCSVCNIYLLVYICIHISQSHWNLSLNTVSKASQWTVILNYWYFLLLPPWFFNANNSETSFFQLSTGLNVAMTLTFYLVKMTRKLLEAKNAPQMAIVYKRQNLYSNTTCTPRHDKENNLIWKKERLFK